MLGLGLVHAANDIIDSLGNVVDIFRGHWGNQHRTLMHFRGGNDTYSH